MKLDGLFEVQIVKQMRKNYALYPIVVAALFGMGLAGFQITRSLLKSPDLHVNRKNNPDPWNRLNDDGKYVQFKYFSTMDYKALAEKNERPKIE